MQVTSHPRLSGSASLLVAFPVVRTLVIYPFSVLALSMTLGSVLYLPFF
jgi:hypothetical protein